MIHETGEFMELEVTDKQDWWEIDSDEGTVCLPREYFTEDQAQENVSSEVYEINKVSGHGARLTAPGYLDCTGWSVYDTEREALKAMLDMHFDGDPEDQTDEINALWALAGE